MKYFNDDIILVNISDGMETNGVELSPNITAEIDENGELIGIEILNASTFVRDSILETAQAKLINLQSSIVNSHHLVRRPEDH